MQETARRPRGRVRGYTVDDTPYMLRPDDKFLPSRPDGRAANVCWRRRTDWQHNDVLYEWGTILAMLLARRGINYGIGGMYIEYANVASPGDAFAKPTFTRDADQGVQYYDNLALTAMQDYLRVPLVATQIDSEDATLFPKGNRNTFFAQTSGVVGVHGKPFSDAHNSLAIGGALVAFVDPVDASQDLVLSRFYFEEANQIAKLASSQIGYEWQFAGD